MTWLVHKLIRSFLSNIFVYQPLYMYNHYINIDALAYNGDELTINDLQFWHQYTDGCKYLWHEPGSYSYITIQ